MHAAVVLEQQEGREPVLVLLASRPVVEHRLEGVHAPAGNVLLVQRLGVRDHHVVRRVLRLVVAGFVDDELVLLQVVGEDGVVPVVLVSSGTLSCFWVSILPIIWPEVIGGFQA